MKSAGRKNVDIHTVDVFVSHRSGSRRCLVGTVQGGLGTNEGQVSHTQTILRRAAQCSPHAHTHDADQWSLFLDP